MRRSTGFDRLTIEALYLRCEGLCEGCGEPLRGELHSPLGHTGHHRRGRAAVRVFLAEFDGESDYDSATNTWSFPHGGWDEFAVTSP